MEREDLKYKFMNEFDRAMQHLDKAYGFLASSHEYISRKVPHGILTVRLTVHRPISVPPYRLSQRGALGNSALLSLWLLPCFVLLHRLAGCLCR